MKLYLTVIGIAMLIISIFNIIFNTNSWYNIIILVVICTALQFALGGLGGFSKRSLVNPNSPEHIEKFIIECNKGVLTHRLSYPIGFLPMLFIPNVCAFSIAFPVAMVNLFLNILPTLVLRYNTPKLKLMLKRMEKNQKF